MKMNKIIHPNVHQDMDKQYLECRVQVHLTNLNT